MPRRAFTLLEICIAMAIAMLIITIAVPSVKGVLKQNKAQDSFAQFDKLAQEAHSRSLSERRAYILIWSKPDYDEKMTIIVRPDVVQPDSQEAEGIDRLCLTTEEIPNIIGWPAKLVPGNPVAIWVFWPNGSCEPVIVKYSGKSGKWIASYNAFTAQAAVTYD